MTFLTAGELQIFTITLGVGGTVSGAVRQTPEPSLPATASIADELAKFAKLRDDGILSAEEFDAQKAKLLGQQ